MYNKLHYENWNSEETEIIIKKKLKEEIYLDNPIL